MKPNICTALDVGAVAASVAASLPTLVMSMNLICYFIVGCACHHDSLFLGGEVVRLSHAKI